MKYFSHVTQGGMKGTVLRKGKKHIQNSSICNKDTAPTFFLRTLKCFVDSDSSGNILLHTVNDVPAAHEMFVNADISSQTLNCSHNSSHNYAVPEFNNCRFERIEIVTSFYAKLKIRTIILLRDHKNPLKTYQFAKGYCSHIFPFASDNVSVVTVELLLSR